MRGAMSTDGRPRLGNIPYWPRLLSVAQATASVGPREIGRDADE